MQAVELFARSHVHKSTQKHPVIPSFHYRFWLLALISLRLSLTCNRASKRCGVCGGLASAFRFILLRVLRNTTLLLPASHACCRDELFLPSDERATIRSMCVQQHTPTPHIILLLKCTHRISNRVQTRRDTSNQVLLARHGNQSLAFILPSAANCQRQSLHNHG
jgi:hypothetical protein